VIIGIPKEIKTGEQRVAMTPANIEFLTAKGLQVLFQTDAGTAAGYPDAEYAAAGAKSSLLDPTLKTVTMIWPACAVAS
jgi:alanine dehydrogenase